MSTVLNVDVVALLERLKAVEIGVALCQKTEITNTTILRQEVAMAQDKATKMYQLKDELETSLKTAQDDSGHLKMLTWTLGITAIVLVVHIFIS